MKKTAPQSAGVATNQAPPINHRLESVYHNRRPNAVVRGLYACFYWLGDFGPMFAELFRFIGRSILVTVNMIILVGIIIISFSHSLELLRYAGLRNGLEWVGVVVWELAFIFSSMVLSRDFKQGNWRSGWAPWTGFIMGLAFVMVSNYTGMADNPTGRILGVATPLLLLVFKGVLAHQFKKQKETPTREEIREPESETGRMKREDREITPALTPAPGEEEAAATREDVVVDSPAPAAIVATREDREEQREEIRETAPTSSPVVNREESPATPGDLEDVGTPAAVVDSPAPTMEDGREEMETGREEEAGITPATQAGESTQEEDRGEVVATRERETDREEIRKQEVETPPTQVEGDREEKETPTHREDNREEEEPPKPPTREEVKKKAMEILEAEGELPGRRRLMKETGSPTDWIPRKVLEKLEKELKKGQAS